MHRNSMKLMEYFRDKYLSRLIHVTVLDVGSMVQAEGLNQSYRELFDSYRYDYTGMDVEAGNNVDLVGYHSITQKYDVVISGQVMEHVNRPWEWLKNLTDYFISYICIIAPNTLHEHRYPIDTYRYFPDGMRDLFDYAGIKEIEIFKSHKDTVGIGAHHV